MDQFYEAIIFIIVWIISVVIKHFMKGSQNREMKELADRLSLDFDEGGLFSGSRVVGIFEGKEVLIYNFYQGNNRDKQMYYRVQMMFDHPFPDNVRVYNSISFGPVSGLFSEISELFGIHDVEFDNSVFDQKFVVRAHSEAVAKKILDDESQESLIGLGTVNLMIQDGEAFFIEEGNAASNENKIRTKLYLLAKLVANINNAASTGAFEKISRPKQVPVAAPQQQYAFSVQSSRSPLVGDQMPGGIRVSSLQADIIPQRSDYYPEPVSPEDVVRQMKREGYYTGD